MMNPRAPRVDDALVDDILKTEESAVFETKRIGTKNDKKLETILAFSNTEGGFLVIGLEDAAKAQGRDRVIGISENAESIDELHRLVRSRITPPLAPPDALAPQFHHIGCTLRDGSKGSIVIVRVEKSPLVHSLIDGGTFVRLNKSNRQISAAEITELALQRGVVSYVAQPVDVRLDLLKTAFWDQYAASRRLTRPFPDVLEHLGLAKRLPEGTLKPTRASVLLFAEDPSGLLDEKCSVRVFQYRGDHVEHGPSTNLMRPPRSISGPLVAQIRDATEAVVDALASGVRVGELGFEIAQRYPLRVLREAITNAVIHRDYRVQGDIHVGVFDNRVVIESPGLFPGAVTADNIFIVGSHPRNRAIVDHLREFPNPPNLDAGEGVRMMLDVMGRATLFPPIYFSRPDLDRDAVRVVLLNQDRPSVWTQVDAHLEKHGTIGNAEVRRLLRTDDSVKASKLIHGWVESGLLVVDNPTAGKRARRYRRPGPGAGMAVLFPKAGKRTTGDGDD